MDCEPLDLNVSNAVLGSILGGIDISGHRGIYDKYQVTRKETGEICDGAFVLRPVTDIAARIALATYAEVKGFPPSDLGYLPIKIRIRSTRFNGKNRRWVELKVFD